MVMFKIIVFFLMLFGFFAVSWLWHWAWFGTGEEFLRNRLAPTMSTTVRAILAVLVSVELIGLYLATYWMLT